MNWYIVSQKWEKFPPNRQREFQFMHEPGYNRKAPSYIGEDYDYMLDGMEFDFNMYHVTTNLPGVVNSGRLKSRMELDDSQIGLGGGVFNSGFSLVSVTYDINRARQIYDDIKFVTEIASGSVKAHDVLFAITEKVYGFDESPEFYEIISSRVGDELYRKYLQNDVSWEEVERVFDGSFSGGKELYDFMTYLEGVITTWDGFNNEYSEDFSPMPSTGFTASFEEMQKINPTNVAILQLVARKGAKAEHVPEELELRFNSSDLRVVRVLQP